MTSLDAVTTERMSVAMRALSRRARPVAAYLFGSRAEGRADQWSDYDLAVFIEGAEQWDLPGVARFCAGIQAEAGDDIELHIFPASDHDRPEKGSFAEYILRRGIPVQTGE
jgi:predicted nucleotidyltransferase